MRIESPSSTQVARTPWAPSGGAGGDPTQSAEFQKRPVSFGLEMI